MIGLLAVGTFLFGVVVLAAGFLRR